jgi:predicted dehydrogenase
MPVTLDRTGETEVFTLQSENRFKLQIDEFSDCILTGRTPEFPVEDAINNMAAILALYTSAETGRIVKLDEM